MILLVIRRGESEADILNVHEGRAVNVLDRVVSGNGKGALTQGDDRF